MPINIPLKLVHLIWIEAVEEYLDLLNTTDAKIWAEKFIQAIQEIPEIKMDQATMEAWFANAIMTGFDARKNPQIIKLKTDEATPLGGWANHELGEIVKIEGSDIIVRLLDEFLAKGFQQDLAIAKGYSQGYVVVKAQNISTL